MKMQAIFATTMAAAAVLVTPALSQQGSPAGAQRGAAAAKRTPANQEQPLVLTEAVPFENAKGRFDHFAMGGGRLFVAALGSDAVEVINIGGRILEHTITGIPDPQGIALSPEGTKLFVASGRGKVFTSITASLTIRSRPSTSREAPITSATMGRPNVFMSVAEMMKTRERSR